MTEKQKRGVHKTVESMKESIRIYENDIADYQKKLDAVRLLADQMRIAAYPPTVFTGCTVSKMIKSAIGDDE